MRTDVIFYVFFSIKPLQTNPALKRLFIGVSSLVLLEMTPESEGFFALGTLEWSVVGML